MAAFFILATCFAQADEVAPLEKLQAGTKAGQEWADNTLNMKFCWCPPGQFLMGSPVRDADRKENEDQVKVTLTRGFWLGKYEVTQEEWIDVMGTKPWRGQREVKEGDYYPVTCVHREDALEFCRKLTAKEHQTGRLPKDWEYSLPTEAQWEYACRAGTTTRFAFGDDWSELIDYAWYISWPTNASETNPVTIELHPIQVGQKKTNAWGLHDMHGNVSEWCRDWYQGKLQGGINPEMTKLQLDVLKALDQAETDPLIPFAQLLRGGCYGDLRGLRSAARQPSQPNLRFPNFGFRIAIVPSKTN
jgi:formylglycine-generating enzyme required for sulfatase activity